MVEVLPNSSNRKWTEWKLSGLNIYKIGGSSVKLYESYAWYAATKKVARKNLIFDDFLKIKNLKTGLAIGSFWICSTWKGKRELIISHILFSKLWNLERAFLELHHVIKNLSLPKNEPVKPPLSELYRTLLRLGSWSPVTLPILW